MKLLIANRGEIASRIIRTARTMGIQTVAVFSDADKDLPFIAEADEGVNIGGNAPSDSYLVQDKIIEAARRTNATAIHPGFGFLSENATFVKRVESEGLFFVGPSASSMEAMGSKAQSKILLRGNPNVPLVPGYEGENQTIEVLTQEALRIGFPLLLKASAGGGGKGMRIVHSQTELAQALQAAQNEGLSSFGDGRLIVERYFPNARHIEVQVMGDKHGKVLHFGERECSMQRRFQKILEEAPSPSLTQALREQVCAAAVAVAEAVDYHNAGTVEFLFDEASQSFFFLEMNTRLQVEHTVTEEVYGVDLVRLQLEVAQGLPLNIEQSEIRPKGHSIEARLYAEDASHDYKPAIGKVIYWAVPSGSRNEVGLGTGDEINVFYDPMIAKIISKGENRLEATAKLRQALGELCCLGTITNRYFLMQLLGTEAWAGNKFDTNFLQRAHSDIVDLQKPSVAHFEEAMIASTIYHFYQRAEKQTLLKFVPSGWRNLPYQSQFDDYQIPVHPNISKLNYASKGDGQFEITIAENSFTVKCVQHSHNALVLEINGTRKRLDIAVSENDCYAKTLDGPDIHIKLLNRFPEIQAAVVPGSYNAPVPGEVVRVMVNAGEKIESGQALLTLLSMKMENTIYANEAGTVEEVFVEVGQVIKADAQLLKVGRILDAR